MEVIIRGYNNTGKVIFTRQFEIANMNMLAEVLETYKTTISGVVRITTDIAL